MKKHKSVVAILLAVMMIFTMMPMMAFADDGTTPSTLPDLSKVKWSDDYSTVSVPAYRGYLDGSDGLVDIPAKDYKTERNYNGGVIEVKIDPAEQKKYNWELPDNVETEYFDLSVAELAHDGVALKDEYVFGTFDPAKVKGIALNVPAYVANYKEASEAFKTNPVVVEFTAFETATNWHGVLVGAEEDKYDKNARTEQTLKLSFGGKFNGSAENYTAFVGAIPEKTVKILAATPDPNFDAKYYFDDVEDSRAVKGSENATVACETLYDGAAHSFVASAVNGWTPAFSVLDLSTGKWNDTTSVTLSDIQEKATQVKVVWTNNADNKLKRTHMFDLNLVSAGVAKVEFDQYVHLVKGTTYNAADYVVAAANATYSKYASDEAKASAKLLDAATKKAVAANEKDLIAYFNEMYDVVDAVSEYNPNLVYLNFEEKDLTQKEKAAIQKKYATLIARFADITAESIYDQEGDVVVNVMDTAVVALNGVDPTDYEIEFTQAPAKKVIKTKKAKSTKKVTFNVKAECKNGTLVKYKLINAPKKSISIDANTGKITVKKGLAKGTYTFKVKAYVPKSHVDEYLVDTDSRDSLSEVQTIKVVVKKTKKK